MLRSLQPPSGWEGEKGRMEYSDSNLTLQSQSTFYPGKTNGLFHHEMNTHILSGGHEKCSNESNCSGKCEITLAWVFFFFLIFIFSIKLSMLTWELRNDGHTSSSHTSSPSHLLWTPLCVDIRL